MKKIKVLEKEISLYSQKEEDYICITDIARYKHSDRTDDLIRNWPRNRNTIEFLGIWEHLNNPDFKPVEFDGFKKQAGLNSFTLTPKQWIEKTNAIGLISKAGRYGGTYAHKDIAFEFASWISVEFKLYLIKEFQRLKDEEQKQLGWDIKRNLAKINYRIFRLPLTAYSTRTSAGSPRMKLLVSQAMKSCCCREPDSRPLAQFETLSLGSI